MSPSNFFITDDLYLRKMRVFWFHHFRLHAAETGSAALGQISESIQRDAIEWTREEIQKEQDRPSDFVIGTNY